MDVTCTALLVTPATVSANPLLWYFAVLVQLHLQASDTLCASSLASCHKPAAQKILAEGCPAAVMMDLLKANVASTAQLQLQPPHGCLQADHGNLNVRCQFAIHQCLLLQQQLHALLQLRCSLRNVLLHSCWLHCLQLPAVRLLDMRQPWHALERTGQLSMQLAPNVLLGLDQRAIS
jgi:hypothetical protein